MVTWFKALASVAFAGAASSLVTIYVDPLHFNIFTSAGLFEIGKVFAGALILHALTFAAKNPFPISFPGMGEIKK